MITDTVDESFRTASYDLRLGDEYYLSSLDTSMGLPVETTKLDGQHKLVEIPPHQVALVIMAERVNLPNSLVGHLSLKLDVLLQGLIMASQSQIDAGYRGPIYALLYNLSNRHVSLAYKSPILRVEFAQLDKETEGYRGDYKPGFRLADAMPIRITSSLASLSNNLTSAQREVKKAQEDVRNTRFAGFFGVLAIIVGAFAVINPIGNDSREAKTTAEQVGERVAELRSQLDDEQANVADLDARVRLLMQRVERLRGE